MPEGRSAATDLDLISYLKEISDARMRRGVRIPTWYLVLVAVLGFELTRPPSDSSFRYFSLQVDVAALCATIREWTMAQIP